MVRAAAGYPVGVPGSPLIPSGSGTFAQMKAVTAPAEGQLYYVSNYGRGGSLWRYSAAASEWYPTAPLVIYENNTVITGLMQTGDQVLLAIPCEAGILLKKKIRLRFAIGRDGATDSVGSAILRMGLTGTIADTAVSTQPTILTSGRAIGEDAWVRIDTPTSVIKMGGLGFNGYNGASSSIPLGTATTIGDVSGASYITITTTMTTAAANRPQISDVMLEIQS